MMTELAIGVDVGATKIASALVTREGNVAASRQTLTQVQEGEEAVIRRIADEVNALVERAEGEIAGVGIGVPGLVDPSEGIVLNAVNMSWRGVRLQERVGALVRGKLRVQVENDVRGAAMGEALFGAGRGVRDFVLLSIGSGLGSAAMVDGRVLHGARFYASELGHFVVDTRGRKCGCGLYGCAETVISGPGLVETTRSLLGDGVESALHDSAELSTREILAAAGTGDAAACAALDRMGEWLGVVMATATAWLNPARIVVGGGMGLAAFDLIYTPAMRSYEKRVLKESREGVELVRSQVESSAVGAAALVIGE